jgi:hypothetical protein
MKTKTLFTFISFCIISFAIAQTDTTSNYGTIKVGKTKKENIYIRVYRIDSCDALIDSYNASKVNGKFLNMMVYQPFPNVEGYLFPFNYSKYFIEKFKKTEIDLKGKNTDTVSIEIKIETNGKVYIRDDANYMLIKKMPVYPLVKNNEAGYDIKQLHLICLNFLKEIKSWKPGYLAIPKQSTFQKKTVIKAHITTITFVQTLNIVFSTTPFDEEY